MRRQELHGDEDGRVRYETEGCEIFAVEMESDRFPEILRYLIQGLSLGDDRDFRGDHTRRPRAEHLPLRDSVFGADVVGGVFPAASTAHS